MSPERFLQGRVRGKLHRLRRALRARLAGEGLAWLLTALVTVVFVTLGIDYLLRLDDRPLRVAVMGAAGAGVLAVLWRQLLRPLLVPMDAAALALLVERKFRQLGDRLISAIQFGREESLAPLGMSDAMVAATAEQANQIAERLDFDGVVERAGLRRASLTALAAVGLLAGFTVWQYPIMSLWVQRNLAFANVDWPQDTYLRVEGGPDFKVLRGGDLEIVVTVRPGSVAPPSITMHSEYASLGRTEAEVQPATPDGMRFVHTFRNVSEEFSFYVTGGDDRLDARRKHHVYLVDPPALHAVRFTLCPPSYVDRPKRSMDGTRATLPAGCGWRVELDARATKDLRAATMRVDCPTVRRQQRLCEELAEAAGRLEAPSERGALADWLGRLGERQAEIIATVADNPPPGERYSAATATAQIVRPLGDLARRLADGAAGAQQVAEANAVLAGARRLHAWLREVPMTVSAVRAGGPPRRVAGSFYVWGPNRATPITLAVVMTDTEGIANVRGAQFLLQVNPDTAPVVEIQREGVSTAITANARLPLATRIKDDYGIASAEVACAVAGEDARRDAMAIDLGGAREEHRGKAVFDLLGRRALALAPGDRLKLWVSARDALPERFGGPGNGRSSRLEFRVVEPDKLLEELVLRHRAVRDNFHHAIRRQVEARGKTLGARKRLEALHDDDPPAAVRTLLADSGKLQGVVGEGCTKAADQLAAINQEMRNNRLGNEDDLQAIELNVISPLRALAGDAEQTTAELEATPEIRDAAALGTAAERIDRTQQRLHERMEAVLAEMEEIGTRQEVYQKLQRILGISRDLLSRIRRLAERETEGVFDNPPGER
jgi:hypothetical protein